MPSEPKPAVVLRASDIETRSGDFTHPWNPLSEMHGAPLGRPTGLGRCGVNLIRIAPGKESFVYHAHLHEEEWLYVLSGRAIVDSGEDQHEVGAGDFVAFPTPSAPHQLRNPFDQDVVYLTGGEHADFDVVDYPRHGKRMVRLGAPATVYALAGGEPFPADGIDKL